jgi:5-methylcytosine-specific restriction protein A
MPEITFTRSTGSYAKGATVDMGAATAAHLVQHGAAEYTNGPSHQAQAQAQALASQAGRTEGQAHPPRRQGHPRQQRGQPHPRVNGTPHGWRVTPLPPDWGTTRRRILTRDRHKCYMCGAHAPEVDHITPASQHGTDDDSNLAAICVRCHRRKTSAEGVAARAKPPRQRPAESHPGTLTDR